MNPAELAQRAPSETLLERITRSMPTMRKSERKVGEVVLAAPGRAMNFTMAECAEAAGVSEPTVMRFCSSIGCDGFQDFRIQLAQTMALGLPVTHSAITADDTAGDLAEKIFNHTISSLDRARRNLDQDSVERAIQALLAAESVLFVGFGASGIIAQDAQQKFPLFGVPCDAPADFHQQFIAASVSGPRTVTFAISNTGHTAETLTVAREAKSAGSTVIALVGSDSPLADLADIALKAVTFEDTDIYTPSTSRLAGLVVIDILATGVAMRRGPEHQEKIRRMKSRLATMRHEVPGAPARRVGEAGEGE
ncbi:RpiR family carbohydrate utilization transcriptional regulator [Thermocatellispora tengchongensis]|uniref:RpiR family carbohydrate utilization transcriptional regulator n=1 Tax=Thermocatellispora tengchongensis TaxID=1073253 RepID=A0A840P1X1_9ACTN|nr:SIS domain-containing protein [Thermocatellispora tengchongensis]MBB5131460.1 RpiR family carbohydrate utilization transcriptional regulator [Thermocatellispora tengchongensis]